MTLLVKPPRAQVTREEQKWREAVSKAATRSGWREWTPTIGQWGSLTWAVSEIKAFYIENDDTVYYEAKALGAAGGSAAGGVTFTLPLAPAETVLGGFGAWISTGGVYVPGYGYYNGGVMTLRRVDHVDFANSGTLTVWTCGTYRI
jgi:hypothetical protein